MYRFFAKLYLLVFSFVEAAMLLALFSVKAGLVYVMLHLSHLDVHPSTAPLLPYYRLQKYGREPYSCLDLSAGFCLILLIFLHSIIHIHNIARFKGTHVLRSSVYVLVGAPSLPRYFYFVYYIFIYLRLYLYLCYVSS